MIHAMAGLNTHVISVQPLDPETWSQENEGNQENPRRVATIKQRAGAVCCRATGLLLGLEVCTTINCFLQFYMTSPDKLDQMTYLCDKHQSTLDFRLDLAALTNHGFLPPPWMRPRFKLRIQQRIAR